MNGTQILKEWVSEKLTDRNREARAFAHYLAGKYGRAETVLPGITKILRKNSYLERGGKRISISKEDEKHAGIWVCMTILLLQGKVKAKRLER